MHASDDTVVSILCYRAADDSLPVVEWLEQQPMAAREKCRAAIQALARQGHTARRPLVENVGSGIYELRVRLIHVNYRVLFCFYGRSAVVLCHGLTKERRLRQQDIEVADRRRGEIERDPAQRLVEVVL